MSKNNKNVCALCGGTMTAGGSTLSPDYISQWHTCTKCEATQLTFRSKELEIENITTKKKGEKSTRIFLKHEEAVASMQDVAAWENFKKKYNQTPLEFLKEATRKLRSMNI